MSQFLETFYEESFEGLETMETELLNLDVGAADPETINTIFRAAHSIKGGSGTFGLTAVADFTHVMETLLDEMRDGKREVTQESVNILLNSVDVLHSMLSALRADEELDSEAIGAAQKQLDELLAGNTDNAAPVAATAQSETANNKASGWHIAFKPHTDMLKTGNDPVRMFRELASLGDLKVEVNLDDLPPFAELAPEDAYLGWELELDANVERAAIDDVFDWVEDECDLSITQKASPAETESAADALPGLDDFDIDILEQTFFNFKQKGEAFTRKFYDTLFADFPQVKPLFANSTPEAQAQKLLAALELVVDNLRNPQALIKAVSELGQRHHNYGAEPEHYAAVVNTMLKVMEAESDTIPWSEYIHDTWNTALNLVADVMKKTYQEKQPEQNTEPASQAATAGKAKHARKAKAGAGGESSSIRVSIDKVDDLINMMGELVITQSMLSQLGEEDEFSISHIEKLRDGLAQLERNTRELQENVMRIRMLPISFAFQRFPRLVHDLSGKLGKNIELKMSGEQTELDKTVMEKIGDPLVHLVRNSLDHGIEAPEQRLAAGKSETGVIHLNAFHEGGNIIIEISDDGAGLNKARILEKAKQNGLVAETDQLSDDEIHDLIFQPGFSTAQVVSDVSGRGVGMDVVRKNIRSLGGTVEVSSEEGVGSTFRIRLPLTLAILDGQSIRVGEETYILPLVSIIESIQVDPSLVQGVTGQAEVYRLRDEYIPIVRLYNIFGIEPDSDELANGLLVIVEADGQKIALFVDDLLGQQQVVIKSLETNYKKVDGISGATILGDGTVALILDISGLIHLSRKTRVKAVPGRSSGGSSEAA
ncbi:MAG: chemotaxis protein CheW [Thioalkalispiraceae bacterium]|jgi:two-component system chemotaxis sensor kinase CheA